MDELYKVKTEYRAYMFHTRIEKGIHKLTFGAYDRLKLFVGIGIDN